MFVNLFNRCYFLIYITQKKIHELSPYITQSIFSSSKLINCELSSKSN